MAPPDPALSSLPRGRRGQQEHAGRLIAMLIAALVGAGVCSIAFVPGFLAGTGAAWDWPSEDYGAYVTAGAYFLRDRWRVPLFALPAMGYPEGGSVIFNDAIPLAALIDKLLRPVTGQEPHYLGWWMVVAYALQAAMAARFVWAIGVRSRPAVVGLASLAVLATPFIGRFGHIALMSHFLLLWAFASYVEQVRARRPAVVEQTCLALTAILINPYMAAMVVVVLAATWGTLLKDRVLHWRSLLRPLISAISVVGLAMAVCGYFSLPASTRSLMTSEYGHWSWNPITLVVAPPTGVWTPVTSGVIRNVTGGQYEGESYIGLAPALLAIVYLVTRPGEARRALARHWPLAVAVAACALFAASTRVYVGSFLLIDLPTPRWSGVVTGPLRSHGRFIWLAMYLVMLVPAACLARVWPRAVTLVAMLVAVTIQAVEARPMLQWSRAASATPTVATFDVARMTAWMKRHERIWQYPSWWCGGTAPVHEEAQRAKIRLSQLGVLAARLALPYNSIYMSRPLKDCYTEQDWTVDPELEKGTLYVLVSDTNVRSRKVDDLARSNRCVNVGWAHVCSADPLVP